MRPMISATLLMLMALGTASPAPAAPGAFPVQAGLVAHGTSASGLESISSLSAAIIGTTRPGAALTNARLLHR